MYKGIRANFLAHFGSSPLQVSLHLQHSDGSTGTTMEQTDNSYSLRCMKPIPVQINEIEKYKFKAEPNPFLDKTTISLNFESNAIQYITFTDQWGKSIKFDYDISNNEIIVRRKSQPAGMYFLFIETKKNQKITIKLIAH